MIRTIASTLLLSGALFFSCAAPEQPSKGALAPEINAGVWFNSEDAAPTLASLRGKTALIEFWATW